MYNFFFFIAFPTQTLPPATVASTVVDSLPQTPNSYAQSTACSTHHVQVATQTQAPATSTTLAAATNDKKQACTVTGNTNVTGKGKKARYPVLPQQQLCQQQTTPPVQQQGPNFPAQSYQLDPAAGLFYTTAVAQYLKSEKPQFHSNSQ